jgi:hypothetical protein
MTVDIHPLASFVTYRAYASSCGPAWALRLTVTLPPKKPGPGVIERRGEYFSVTRLVGPRLDHHLV